MTSFRICLHVRAGQQDSSRGAQGSLRRKLPHPLLVSPDPQRPASGRCCCPTMTAIENLQACWAIDATNGFQHVQCRLVGVLPDPDIVCCEFQVAREFWNRCDAIAQAALVADLGVELPQVLISISMLRQLRARLDDWMACRSSFACQICPEGHGDQTLMVSIGTRIDVICSTEKPTFTLTYQCGHSMVAEWAFVVDQSCMRGWRESLQAFLLSSGNS